eukprot:2529255-Amphidinium_carterae.1
MATHRQRTIQKKKKKKNTDDVTICEVTDSVFYESLLEKDQPWKKGPSLAHVRGKDPDTALKQRERR